MDDVENFPWMKSVFQAFSRTFPGEYSNEALKILHMNLQIEIQKAIKNKDQECLQKLFSCLRYLYSHFCWKINNLKNHSVMKISCVKILSSLIQIGIILSNKNSAFNSINIILAALKIFPGTFEMLCDAFLILNNWKKHHYEDFGLVLKQFLFTSKFDVKEPSSYFKALLLLRRLKLLSKDSFEKSKIISLAKKMKVPSDGISWMLENGIENASTLSNKSIVKQFFSKKLPATFFAELRQVLQKELYEKFLTVDSKTDTAESSVFDGSDIFKIDLERDECLIANSSNENEAVYYNKKEIYSPNKNVLIENDVLLFSNTFDKNSFPLHSQQAESVTDSFVSDQSESSSCNNFYKQNNQANIIMINKKAEIIQASSTCVENSITNVFLNPKEEIIESAGIESSLIANVDTHKHCDKRSKEYDRKISIENEIVPSSNTDNELLNRLPLSTSNKIGIDENGSSNASLLEISPEVCCSSTESSDLQMKVDEILPKLNKTNNVNNAERIIEHFTESSFDSEEFQKRREEVLNNLKNPVFKICQAAVKDCEIENTSGESKTPISNSEKCVADSSSNSDILTKVNCLTPSESCLEIQVSKENNQSLEVCEEFKKGKHSCDTLKQSQNDDSVPQFEIIQTKSSFDCSHMPDGKEVLDSYIGNVLYKIVDKVANQIDNNNENNSFETLKETVLNEDITPLKNPSQTSSNSVSQNSSLHNTSNPFSLGKNAEYLSFSDVSLDSVKNKKCDNVVSASLFNKVTGKYNNYRDLVRDDISDSASNVVIDDGECNESDSDVEIDSAECVLFDEDLKQDITCNKNNKEICEENCNPLPESQQFFNESTKAYQQSFNMEEANIFVDLQPKLVVNLGKKCKADEDFYCENRYKVQTCIEEHKNELQNIKELKECTEINQEISINNCKSPEGLFYQLNANLDTISKEENTNLNKMELQENYSSSYTKNGEPLSQSNTKELTLSTIDHSEHVESTKSPTQEKSLSLQLKTPFQPESTTVAVENHNVSEHVEFINSPIQEKNFSIQLKLPTPNASTTATVEKVQPRMNLRKRNLPPVDENQNFKKTRLSKKRYSSKVPDSHDVNLDISKLTIGSPVEKKLCKTTSATKNKKEEKAIFQLSNRNTDVRNEESKQIKSYNLRSNSSLIKPSRLKF